MNTELFINNLSEESIPKFRCEISMFQKQVFLFDLTKMDFFMHGNRHIYAGRVEADYYFIKPMYRYKLKSYLGIINEMLSSVSSKYNLPPMSFEFNDLIYIRTNELINNFCIFFFHPYDYNHDLAKTPYSITLHCDTKPNSFVDLYFDRDFSITGGRIVYWIETKCFLFDISPYYNDTLQIVSAYLHEGNEETRYFDISYERYLKRKAEYEWICANIPRLAPKSLNGYTRMKRSQSANYLKLKDYAAHRGMILDDDL